MKYEYIESLTENFTKVRENESALRLKWETFKANSNKFERNLKEIWKKFEKILTSNRKIDRKFICLRNLSCTVLKRFLNFCGSLLKNSQFPPHYFLKISLYRCCRLSLNSKSFPKFLKFSAISTKFLQKLTWISFNIAFSFLREHADIFLKLPFSTDY